MSNKIYPIGIQNFEKIRNDGYFYIDKTALMYQMVKTGSYYFLSRPRRFGKSLLISTRITTRCPVFSNDTGKAQGKECFRRTGAVLAFPIFKIIIQYFIQTFQRVILLNIKVEMQYRMLYPILFKLYCREN